MARPQFIPNEEQRRLVKSMAGLGMRQEEIAYTLNLAPATLRKHFRQELKLGSIETNANVANAAYKMAVSGKCPVMTKLWLETRNGWGRRATTEPASVLPPQFHIKIEGP